MIKKIIVPVVFLFMGLVATAQLGTASPYSFYGIGSLKFKGTMESQAMGGISLYPDSLSLNIQNPAALGKLNFTSYSLGASFSSLNLKSDANNATAKSASFDYLALGFPLSRNVGLSFGVLPYTAVGYALNSTNDGGTITEYNQFEGEGGMNKAYVSLGIDITKDFSVGVVGNYDFGNLENTVTNSRDGVELSSREYNRSELSGLDFKFALNYKHDFKEKFTWYSSLMYVPESKINSDNSRTYSTGLLYESGAFVTSTEYDADLESIGLNKTDLVLPSRTTLGLGIGNNTKWFVGAEYEYIEMSKLSNPFNSIQGLQYQNAYSLSLGGLWVPNYNSFTSYMKRATYRLGVKYQNTGMILNNEEINDFGISFGIGLPVARISKINLGIEVGKRGTTSSGLVQENYVNLKVGLTLLDRWFIKSKFN